MKILSDYILQFFKYAKLFFIKKNSPFILIDKPSQISLPVKIGRFSRLKNTKIDEFSYTGASCRFINCTIGKFCSIADNVKVGLPSHPSNYLSTSPIFFSRSNGTGESWVNTDSFNGYPKPTIIENDVWIGSGVMIIGGVRIGNGAIVAAGSIVTKDIPDYSIYGGVPAKKLKARFPPDVIDILQQIQWWDIEQGKLEQKLKFFNRPLDEIMDKINQLKH